MRDDGNTTSRVVRPWGGGGVLCGHGVVTHPTMDVEVLWPEAPILGGGCSLDPHLRYIMHLC